MPLGKSEIIWREGVPVASAFDDPYYSVDGGLEESRFVFLDGTSIHENFNRNRKLVIAETGFGTGLNFLATWQRWREQGQKGRLTFLSTEAYPMSCDDLERAHSAFPELDELTAQLRAAWPPPSAGFHFRQFDEGGVSLLLMFGDAATSFGRLKAKVDAWYLDGFAPAKNPEMWTEELFAQIARLSNPGAKLATFTAAGFVKRGLSANGFEMAKTPGFGRKRERLVGIFTPQSNEQLAVPPKHTWATTPAASGKNIAILGLGIAGASLTRSLKLRGYNTTLVGNPKQPHTSTGLPAAVTVPHFILGDEIEREFYISAYAYCVTHPVFQPLFVQPLGARILAQNIDERERFAKIISRYNWPSDWLKLDNDMLSLPRSGTLSPNEVLEKLTNGSEKIEADIARLERTNDQWSVIGYHNETIITADIIVLAAGIHTSEILKNSGLSNKTHLEHPILRPSSGQVEILTENTLAALSQDTLSYGGYVSATLGASKAGHRVIGSTFERMEKLPDTALSPTMANRETILQELKGKTGVHISPDMKDIQSWSGVRAMVPDHMPYAGPVPDWSDTQEVCALLARDANLNLTRAPKTVDGLYMLSGLGSKGFQYAPLLAEFVAAMIGGEPLPLPDNLVPKLHPARSFIRAIKKHTQ